MSEGVSTEASLLERARSRYLDLYIAATGGMASFQHLLQVRRVRRKFRNPEQWLDREISRALEPKIRERFEAVHGRVVSDYYASYALAGCLLTEHDELHLAMNVDDASIVALQVQLEQLARDAQRTFDGKRLRPQRREAGNAVFSIASRLVATVDVLQAPEPADAAGQDRLRLDRQEALKAVSREWTLTQRRIEVLIQRQARFEYFTGVLAGAPFALLLFSIIGALATAHWSQQISTPAFVAATLSGVVGGVISVTQRMSNGQLVLDYTASPAQKRLLGGVRPLVAGTFAAVVQFGLLGGLLTMQGAQPTASTPATFAFFALAGFAAGFSERLATDMIERAGQLMAPATAAGALQSSSLGEGSALDGILSAATTPSGPRTRPARPSPLGKANPPTDRNGRNSSSPPSD